ncbi:related to RTA1 domain protein [Phialocephala subalpina]|uniref:Related to RTA1 domain protein n=1 Tax=Phialocephala subalpina TaxID=576137 RepID=A0A1L7XDE5_9HELO|nr:related to RTA1 domain protein [Phialocephala subalpina]
MPQMNNGGGCTLDTCPLSMGIVHYDPSLFANTFYLTYFGVILIVQVLQTWRFRAWSFSIPVMSGLILEIVGYAGRIQMHYNPFDPNPFLIYLVCLTIGPVFFSAAIYLTLSRIIVHYGVRYTWFTPKRTSIIFMSCDFVALVMQAAGGAIADTADTKRASNQGVHILVAGLAFQVLSLLFFVGVSLQYTMAVMRLRKGVDVAVQIPHRYLKTLNLGKRATSQFNRFLIGLSLATIFILTRSIFRVAELWKGFDGKLANEEVPFVVFECTTMMLAVAMLTFFHPGSIFGNEWRDSGWGPTVAKEISNTSSESYDMDGGRVGSFGVDREGKIRDAEMVDVELGL